MRKTNLTCGVHMSAREEREGVTDGRRDSKKKAYFTEYAIGARVGRAASGPGKPGGLGRPAGQGRVGEGRPAGPKVRKE